MPSRKGSLESNNMQSLSRHATKTLQKRAKTELEK